MCEWVRIEATKIRSDDVQFVMRASPAICGTASAVDPN
jgi:hypothetical protein